MAYDDTLSKLLDMLRKEFKEKCCLYTEAENRISEETKLVYCLNPGNMFTIGTKCFVIKSGQPLIAVHSWLKSIGLEKYSMIFSQHDIEDFFTLPFLSKEILEEMSITDKEDLKKIQNAIDQLRKYSAEEFVANWLIFFGLENHVDMFIEKQINLQNLRFLREKELKEMGINGEERSKLSQFIEKYKGFSSIEETFLWLRNNGFEKYSFHFARYNIPFYALPFVNFFIIDEMGVTQDDQLLLTALQNLKKTPSYKAKAVSFWLRDLEMEKYNIIFVNNNLTDLESLTLLNDKSINKLISDPSDRSKMKTGIQEMKEFQFYYSATASLLQELGMERYSQLFSLHGISIDVLPFLNENLLIEMGISESSDRKKILSAIKKIKNDLPDISNIDDPKVSLGNKKKDINSNHNIKFSSPQKESPIKDNHESRSVRELLSFINQNQPKNKTNNNNSNNVNSTSPQKNNSSHDKKVPKKSNNINIENKSKSNRSSNTSSLSPNTPSPTTPPTNIQSPLKKKTKKKKKKNNSNNLNNNNPNNLSTSTPTQTNEILKKPIKSESDPLFDDLSDDDLDPELKKQLDREVEEFRRRLESVNSHGTKSKLAPIFYLPN